MNISFYGSHNAAFTIADDKKILEVLEVERFLNMKNIGIAQYKTNQDILAIVPRIVKYFQDKYNVKEFDNVINLNTDVNMDNVSHDLAKLIPGKNFINQYRHHQCHAAGAFYQSPYAKALVFSLDGGGDDGKFRIFLADREEGLINLETVANPSLKDKDYNGSDTTDPAAIYWHHPFDLGFPYMVLGDYLKDIQQINLGDGNLVYPGKIMGLCSYGKVRKKWVKAFKEFYLSAPNGGPTEIEYLENGDEIPNPETLDCRVKVRILAEKIGVDLDYDNRLEGQEAYDVAATSQFVFEEMFLLAAKPWFEKYPDLPVCVTGGCGLNIILNTRLVQEFNKEVFVGPNPNDCGLSVGLMANFLQPKEPLDVTYAGPELFDKIQLSEYIETIGLEPTELYNVDTLVDDLAKGHIMGIARGRMEHGPRALGNRSILCNPAIAEMKDILNEKVKHREYYRPFAPMVRLEDVSEYFEWEGESRWMTFCPKVKKEWRKKLPSITHVDNTARIQTVTKEQNPWIYELLTKFKEKTGVGVLLNTSFNVNGKPILNTIRDAFEILGKSEMDGLVIEDTYIKKKVWN
jgi:carbamoyltransferase